MHTGFLDETARFAYPDDGHVHLHVRPAVLRGAALARGRGGLGRNALSSAGSPQSIRGLDPANQIRPATRCRRLRVSSQHRAEDLAGFLPICSRSVAFLSVPVWPPHLAAHMFHLTRVSIDHTLRLPMQLAKRSRVEYTKTGSIHPEYKFMLNSCQQPSNGPVVNRIQQSLKRLQSDRAPYFPLSIAPHLFRPVSLCFLSHPNRFDLI